LDRRLPTIDIEGESQVASDIAASGGVIDLDAAEDRATEIAEDADGADDGVVREPAMAGG
jgi:hypothetical protein